MDIQYCEWCGLNSYNDTIKKGWLQEHLPLSRHRVPVQLRMLVNKTLLPGIDMVDLTVYHSHDPSLKESRWPQKNLTVWRTSTWRRFFLASESSLRHLVRTTFLGAPVLVPYDPLAYVLEQFGTTWNVSITHSDWYGAPRESVSPATHGAKRYHLDEGEFATNLRWCRDCFLQANVRFPRFVLPRALWPMTMLLAVILIYMTKQYRAPSDSIMSFATLTKYGH